MDSKLPIVLEFEALPTSLFGVSRKAAKRLFERMAADLARLEKEVDDAHKRIAEFESQDALIRDSIFASQRAAEQTRLEARQEAARIVDTAKAEAARHESEAQQRLNNLRWEMERLQQERKRMVDRYRSQVEESLRAIDDRTGFLVPEGPASV